MRKGGIGEADHYLTNIEGRQKQKMEEPPSSIIIAAGKIWNQDTKR